MVFSSTIVVVYPVIGSPKVISVSVISPVVVVSVRVTVVGWTSEDSVEDGSLTKGVRVVVCILILVPVGPAFAGGLLVSFGAGGLVFTGSSAVGVTVSKSVISKTVGTVSTTNGGRVKGSIGGTVVSAKALVGVLKMLDSNNGRMGFSSLSKKQQIIKIVLLLQLLY